jgi:hypothetical protein
MWWKKFNFLLEFCPKKNQKNENIDTKYSILVFSNFLFHFVEILPPKKNYDPK